MRGNENKPRIGIFGRRNLGKSSLINCLTGQQISIVSPTGGTTTDPVQKTMELLGVGPVVWVDTAGIDDEGDLGRMRVARSFDILPQCNLVLILFSDNHFSDLERSIADRCKASNTPFLLVHSRADIVAINPSLINHLENEYQQRPIAFSIHDKGAQEQLIESIRQTLPKSSYQHPGLLSGIVHPGDTVVLVTPIDSSAPEGRMILPQVQVLRDILDRDATAHFCKETDLEKTLSNLKSPPQLVITDSQVFGLVAKIVPPEVPLTSFSMVLARAKGPFDQYVKGTPTIDSLKDGDRVLILESCTHDVTCEDIGRVKIPRLIQHHTGRKIDFEIVSGLTSIHRPLTDFQMVIQCGGCVVTAKQIEARLQPAIDAGIPVSNYGLVLAYLNGIFHRSLAPLGYEI